MDEKVIAKKIRAANKDFEDRLRATVLELQYDHDADILYSAFGDPQDAFSFDAGPSDEVVYLRIDMETFKLVGMDILHFRKSFLPKHSDWEKSFKTIFGQLGEGDFCIRMEHHEPALKRNRKVGEVGSYYPKTIRELVTA
jgi:uncharacterized protein YuzE